ncbi:MAG: hypothetical protein RIQ93_2717 [Verrucomicrobiota bacterium]|jgi:iron complex outermembrane receptor protein
MSFSPSLSSLLLCAAISLPAATPQTSAPPATDKIERLNEFVVSAGPDPKTSFDLAQGTSVLAGSELRRLAQNTLGETLSGAPGVSSTYSGPGASRPVIRGLGGDRIRVLENGVGALDASNVSPDHNTALETLFASRIEVLRGPSTLLYGSSAVGGAINVIENTIPDSAPTRDFSGAFELRAGGAARERAAVLSAGAGNKDFALHVNALKQQSDDVRIPGVARSDAEAPSRQPAGILPNSDITRKSGAIGASWFGANGRLGVAVSAYSSTYGVPVDEPISITMQQRRLELEGESKAEMGVLRGARAHFAAGNYTHREVVDRKITNTTFRNKAWEGRLELPHSLCRAVTGTWGMQMERSDFGAVGAEVVTPPSVTARQAVFALEEWKWGEIRLQAGARVERQSIKLGEVAADLPVVPGFAAKTGDRKNRTGASGSLGAVFYPEKDWSVAVNLALSERLPTAQENFSNGPHGGTGAYEVGASNLPNEKSLGLDASIRRRAGFVTGALSAFVHRFDNFIFEEELPAATIPLRHNPEGLTPFQYTARDANFYGGEGELSFHFIDRPGRHFHLDLISDFVRAEERARGEPLPRIPPLRYGLKLNYDDGRWNADLAIKRAQRQNRISAPETSTAGYTMVNANLSYLVVAGRVNYELFARGANLGNARAREHSSFLKNFAPLPGRGLLAGVRLTF